MPPIHTRLADLENQMARLRARRTERIQIAMKLIKTANEDYDCATIPLARRIKEIHEELKAAKRPAKKPVTPAKKPVTPTRPPSSSHDPEWSQQDIDHFYELRNRGDKTRD